MVDKGACDKWFIWNPCNCECECDESCDIGEYLDYENCKCRKSLVNKLIEECNETIDEEVEIVKVKIDVILAYCTLYYFQYFLQLISNLLFLQWRD